MKLFWRILLVALLPLLFALGLGFYRLDAIVRFQRSSSEKANDLKIALLSSRFRSFREERMKNAAILAGANAAARAVQAADTGFLVPWGRLFLDPLRITRIYFTDADGIVIARPHDPYNFGDGLGGHPAFAAALNGRQVNGLFELDGELLIFHAIPVKLYGETVVGALGVGTELTPELLVHLAEGSGLGVEIEVEGFAPVSTGAYRHEKERRPAELFPPMTEESLRIESAAAFIEEDELASDLVLFKRNLLLAIFGISAALFCGFFLLLRRYLRSFSLLVQDLTLLGGGQDDFFELRRKLSHDYRDANHEVSFIAGAIVKLMERVQETITLLEWTSRTDPLTRISNRLHLDSVLESEMKKAHGTKEPLSVLIFDLDHFKRVNDDFGHQAGDQVLRRTAELLKWLVPAGFVGRWGGEEFLAVLPGVAAEEATEFGERIRASVENERFPIERTVTISAGVAETRPGDTPGSLVGRADRGLYEAKATGRNRVVFRGE